MPAKVTKPKHPVLANVPVAKLEAHLKQKIENQWLGRVLSKPKKIAQFFPYIVNPKSVVTEIVDRGLNPVALGQPVPSLENKPVYMIMMPTTAIPMERVATIVKSIERDSFGESAAASTPVAASRLALTMGVNQAYSPDAAKNREFKRYAATFAAQLNEHYPGRRLALRMVPFFWNPWKLQAGFNSKLVFCLEKCYMLVKSHLKCDLNKFNGWMKLTKDTMPKLIPYQDIRNKIMHSDALLELARGFFKSRPKAVQYVHSMDADFVSLKTTKLGLFGHYDKMIEERRLAGKGPPSAMSTGYAAPKSEKMVIIKKGIELDRNVRKAAVDVLPAAGYMTEPNFAFRLVKRTDLRRHSWKGGSDKTTEARRLMSNAFANKLIDPQEIAFSAVGAIQTEIDDAWRTATIKKVLKLTPAVLAQAQTLKALRGLHQSYCNNQILATNVYTALGRKVSDYMEKAIVPFKHLFGVFDPFALIEHLKLKGKYTKAMFDEAMTLYPAYRQAMVEICGGEKPETVLEAIEDEDLREKLKSPIDAQSQVFVDASSAVLEAGYTDEELEKLVRISLETGAVKFQFLSGQ